MMKCPKCSGTDFRIQFLLGVSAPHELECKFSKSVFRRADVHITHANWETLTRICINPKCCWTDNGYGNRVTRLLADKQQLKKRLQLAEELLNECYNACVTRRYPNGELVWSDDKIQMQQLQEKMEDLGVNKATGIDWSRKGL